MLTLQTSKSSLGLWDESGWKRTSPMTNQIRPWKQYRDWQFRANNAWPVFTVLRSLNWPSKQNPGVCFWLLFFSAVHVKIFRTILPFSSDRTLPLVVWSTKTLVDHTTGLFSNAKTARAVLPVFGPVKTAGPEFPPQSVVVLVARFIFDNPWRLLSSPVMFLLL